jgi:cytochrome b6-f complex iron-sulfur subunit
MATEQREGLFAPRESTPKGVGDPGVSAEAPVAGAAHGLRIPRRLILRYGLWGMILAFLGQLSGCFLGFFWPKKVGAFGGTITAGDVSEFEVGDVKVVREGKFYVSRVPEGFLALWWKCPHLGCTVPWRADDPSEDPIAPAGRFNCPCHGSIYDRYGQIITGPAPRPMDLFQVTVEGGKVRVRTGVPIVRVEADHQNDPVPPQ